MFGIPVVWYAVETSPQGMVIAWTGPLPKSIARVRQPLGTGRRTPSRRTMPPPPAFSMAVVAVPRDMRAPARKARVRWVAEGKRRLTCAARQSDGPRRTLRRAGG